MARPIRQNVYAFSPRPPAIPQDPIGSNVAWAQDHFHSCLLAELSIIYSTVVRIL